ncbi:MAG TPA: ATP synthase F0 subunit B [Acidimicrobiales bacterium]|nr:ATP synthase F0 subunit B [Acidimicrobiales bacterium]
MSMDDFGDAAPPVDTEGLIRRVIEMIDGTRALPLSSSVKLDNKEEVLELLEEASHRLPDETRQARWMLKEREEYLAKMQREGDDIVHAARLQAERMVQRTEIVREAQAAARRMVEDARDEARRLRMEAEDYCDQKLAAFEVVLDRTIKTVAAGREKLSITPPPIVDGPDVRVAGVDADEDWGGDEAFFDQDLA